MLTHGLAVLIPFRPRFGAGRLALLWLSLAVAAPEVFGQGCGSPANAIVAENCLPGNPSSEWDISGSGSAAIQGFATDISVNRGQTVRFKVRSTTATAYRLDIYRSGYYNGSGARKVATIQPSASLPQSQPNCLTNAATGLIDCGNWAESASWAVPANAVSGIYFAKLVATAGTTGSSHIFFIVRDDTGGSDLLFQTSDTTWQAYNNYGGNSLYTGSPAGRAYKVSYNRPFATRDVDGGQDWYFAQEYPMVRWLESNGYSVSYTTGVDGERRGASGILGHKVFVSVGHDEYWSGGQRANVESARDQGVHLAFFSGNEVFWKTRWESSIDGSGTAYRTLVCYKETKAGAKIDPSPLWTGTWRDPRLSPPADGGRPENALTGTLFFVNEGSQAIRVSEAEGKLRFWRNTSFASLPPGGSAVTSPGMIGYEADDAPADANAPAGMMRLSTTVYDVGQYLQDYGNTYAPGQSTHSLVLHRRPGGALVFGAGTIRWSWGLDGTHDVGGWGTDERMQQATVNLFADMGAQPGSLRAGLTPAMASSDAIAPVTTILSPTAGAHVAQGTAVTVSGSASDAGGIVAVVEVSTDGGATWKPAAGTTSWTFSWTPPATGNYTLQSRGVDDSGNFETPSAGVAVVADGKVCPCTIWSASAVPVTASDSDTSAVDLGVKFRTSQNGTITGIRFYKGAGNTGTHVGKLWTSAGVQLASVTFTNETASGWQQATFASPVTVTANTVYVASYRAPVGRYSIDEYGLTQAVDSAPLRAFSDAESGGNGVYRYGTTGFPNASWHSANYWVDVVFMPASNDTTAPVISAVAASPSSNGATITWTTDESSNSVVSYGTSAGSLNQSASNAAMVTGHSVTLNALTPSTYYYRVSSADAAGNSATAPAAPATLNFTVTDTTAPVIGGVGAVASATAATIGWTTDEPSTTVVTYGLSAGSMNQSASNASFVTGHGMTLTGLTTGVTYYYRVTSADAAGNSATSPAPPAAPLTFVTAAAAPPVISAVAAMPGLDGAARISWTTDMASTSVVQYGTDANVLNQSASDPAMVTAHVVNLTGLTYGAQYYYRVTSVNAGGAGATSPAPGTAAASFVENLISVFAGSSVPAVAAEAGDTSAVALGMKFRSDVAGTITAIRFYKGSGNTGSHTGRIWSSTGTQLASVTFANETATGWQQQNLPAPLAIAANTTYVVSYHAPVGRYAIDTGFFANGVARGPLHALSNAEGGGNGVYGYGAATVFPSQSWQSSNYWVDAVFVAASSDTTAPVISSVAANASSNSATITWTTDESSNSVVNYGTSAGSLNQSASNAAMVTSHTVMLSGLAPGHLLLPRDLGGCGVE